MKRKLTKQSLFLFFPQNTIIYILFLLLSQVNYTANGQTKEHQTYTDSINWLTKQWNETELQQSKKPNNYLEQAITIANRNKDIQQEAYLYGKMAYNHYLNHRYKESMISLLKKLPLDETLNDSLSIAWVYNYMGNIYYMVGDYTRALNSYNSSLTIYINIKNNEGTSHIYNNLANLYETTNDPTKAEAYYNYSIMLTLENKDTIGLAIAYNNLGNLYYKHFNDSTLAKKSFIKALDFIANAHDDNTRCLVYTNYGNFLLWQGNHAKAKFFLEMGHELAVRNNLSYDIRNLTESLSYMEEMKGNANKSLLYLKQHITIKDSLQNISDASKINYLEYQYLLDKASQRNNFEKSEITRIARIKLVILLFTAIALIFMLTGTIALNKTRNKHAAVLKEKTLLEAKVLQEQLEFKNKETVIITMNLYERNELIKNTIKKLEQLIPNVKQENIKAIEQIVFELRNKMNEHIIKEFEQRFKEVHSNFAKNLSQEHPNLTANDLKLCAFLKMNMNTKDIASLTHQPQNTIEVARKRLRKKLQIEDSSTDLISFLMKY